MNEIVDTFLEILVSHKEPKTNPILSQFNTIKISLLIQRIMWRIFSKKIYPLTTKCRKVESYIEQSMSNYLN